MQHFSSNKFKGTCKVRNDKNTNRIPQKKPMLTELVDMYDGLQSCATYPNKYNLENRYSNGSNTTQEYNFVCDICGILQHLILCYFCTYLKPDTIYMISINELRWHTIGI